MQKLLTRAAVVGLLLGGWLGGAVYAQPGPLSAQIQRALRTLGLTAGGSPTFGTVTATKVLAGDGTAGAPSYSFASDTNTGFVRSGNGQVDLSNSGVAHYRFTNGGLIIPSADPISWTSGAIGASLDLILARDAPNTLAQKNGTNAQTTNLYAYTAGARAAYTGVTCTAVAVTLSGATTATTSFIPAGATVESVATTTTTAITGASGYQVGDGTTAARYGDITGTAVGTASGSANYTTDPRWWTTGARAITLTAKTSNFTGGVVQVMACYRTATGT